MKEIKLTGREMAVLRGIENQGSTGAELVERTQIAAEDLNDILNGMAEVGYVEPFDASGALINRLVKLEEFPEVRFETNPSYAQDLKDAIFRHR